MAHVITHTFAALLLGGAVGPLAAVGAMLPDVSLACSEILFRRAKRERRLTFAEFEAELPSAAIVPYRVAHSMLVPMLLSFLSPSLAVGWMMHLLLDLDTHRGVFAQRPLWPCSWRWPWA